MIKAITFDLDNTLLDFFLMKEKATMAAAKAMIKAGLDIPLARLYKELFSFYLSDIEGNRVFGRFLRSKGKYSSKALSTAISAYNKAKKAYLKPYPGVRSTLAALKRKGLKLGVITDAPRLKAIHRLKGAGIWNYFDFVIGLEDTGRTKPSQLPFRKAINWLKLKPQEVMHVGDWCERDIKGAKSVGMKTCLVRYSKTKYCPGKYVKPDYQIARFRDIRKILK
jgi:HAD superfamily hydrolase (TIGR02253 family)